MPKLLLRLIAFLLVPCLIADPSVAQLARPDVWRAGIVAGGFKSQIPIPICQMYEQQALMERLGTVGHGFTVSTTARIDKEAATEKAAISLTSEPKSLSKPQRRLQKLLHTAIELQTASDELSEHELDKLKRAQHWYYSKTKDTLRAPQSYKASVRHMTSKRSQGGRGKNGSRPGIPFKGLGQEFTRMPETPQFTNYKLGRRMRTPQKRAKKEKALDIFQYPEYAIPTLIKRGYDFKEVLSRLQETRARWNGLPIRISEYSLEQFNRYPQKLRVEDKKFSPENLIADGLWASIPTDTQQALQSHGLQAMIDPAIIKVCALDAYRWAATPYWLKLYLAAAVPRKAWWKRNHGPEGPEAYFFTFNRDKLIHVLIDLVPGTSVSDIDMFVPEEHDEPNVIEFLQRFAKKAAGRVATLADLKDARMPVISPSVDAETRQALTALTPHQKTIIAGHVRSMEWLTEQANLSRLLFAGGQWRVIPPVSGGSGKMPSVQILHPERFEGLTLKHIFWDFRDTLIRGSEMAPGAEPLLALLHHLGIKHSIVTNGADTASMLVAGWGIRSFFTHIRDSLRDGKKAVINALLKEEDLKLNEAVMIGDEGSDVSAAIAAGIPAIGRSGPAGLRDKELIKNGADALVRDYADIAAILKLLGLQVPNVTGQSAVAAATDAAPAAPLSSEVKGEGVTVGNPSRDTVHREGAAPLPFEVKGEGAAPESASDLIHAQEILKYMVRGQLLALLNEAFGVTWVRTRYKGRRIRLGLQENTIDDLAQFLLPELRRRASTRHETFFGYSKNIPSDGAEQRQLEDLIRTNLVKISDKNFTFFYRYGETEKEDLGELRSYLTDLVITKWRQARDEHHPEWLTIYSRHVAGSTGCEPYTLAIEIYRALEHLYHSAMLSDQERQREPFNIWRRRWDVQIDAFDANLNALKQARDGIYGDRDFHVAGVNELFSADPDLKRFFIPHYIDGEGVYQVVDDLRAWVHPIFCDLNDPAQLILLASRRYDVTMSRNTLQYISNADSKRRIIEGLLSSRNSRFTHFLAYLEGHLGLEQLLSIRYKPDGTSQVTPGAAKLRETLLEKYRASSFDMDKFQEAIRLFGLTPDRALPSIFDNLIDSSPVDVRADLAWVLKRHLEFKKNHADPAAPHPSQGGGAAQVNNLSAPTKTGMFVGIGMALYDLLSRHWVAGLFGLIVAFTYMVVNSERFLSRRTSLSPRALLSNSLYLREAA